jgi:hypothetical protein
MSMGSVQPEIQGIALNFSCFGSAILCGRRRDDKLARIDEAAPPAFGKTALIAARPGAMAISRLKAAWTEGS